MCVRAQLSPLVYLNNYRIQSLFSAFSLARANIHATASPTHRPDTDFGVNQHSLWSTTCMTFCVKHVCTGHRHRQESKGGEPGHFPSYGSHNGRTSSRRSRLLACEQLMDPLCPLPRSECGCGPSTRECQRPHKTQLKAVTDLVGAASIRNATAPKTAHIV